jgi:hypothetical protein
MIYKAAPAWTFKGKGKAFIIEINIQLLPNHPLHSPTAPKSSAP